MPTQQLTRHFHLKQIVDFRTRGSSKLDLILTNLADFYDKPYGIPPFGLSDHLTILAFPNIRTKGTQNKKVIYVRDKRPSSIKRVGKFLSEVPWDFMVSCNRSCEENLNNFTCIINYALDTLTPLKAVVTNHNDRPWMNNNLRTLINKRQKAFAQGNQTRFTKCYETKLIFPEKGVASCIMKIRSKI